MSLRSSKGTITKVRLVKGKTSKAVKFRRNGVRVELRGLPAAGSVKLRLTIRTKRKRVLVETKTYKAC